MKNVPIKFRAWCAELGKFVYMVGSSSFILYDDEIYFSDQYDDHYKIKPENMDQLCGYDADGNEVYEGDILIDCAGREYEARLDNIAVDNLGCGTDVCNFTLKKG